MQFSTLLDTIIADQGESRLIIPDDWLQGRTAFGGLQGALALHAMRHWVPADMPLRVFQMTFAAPVYGGEVSAKAQLLREGKNTRHVEARLMQNGQTLALVVGVFGLARSSAVNLALQPAHLPVDAVARPFPFEPGVTPEFTQHFNARLLKGGFPFSGHADPGMVVDVSLRDSSVATEAHVLALADFVPPVALSLLTKPVPGSSLTWMLEMLGEPINGLSLEDWRIEADMLSAQDGYSSQTVTLWSPQHKAIALSRQSMVVFG